MTDDTKWDDNELMDCKVRSRGQNVSGRYKILYLDTFLGICNVSRYFFQKSIVSVSYRKFPKSN